MSKRCKKRHKGMGHNRSLKRGIRDLKHRAKDLDQIYDSLFKLKKSESSQSDTHFDTDDKKTLYCQFCDRYFMDENSLLAHSNEKTHKRRVKELNNYVPYDGY
ncbi:hypothetical protein MACJ_002959 [Theileria orientalis]|uniref:Matrin-type domain-containing protein n=1 Tax=Theileria orientalis TaxID=68886 RepID=A0A976M741_THEOR|nr:hypothetical protein MACJ_002959 [Theileria orientalis]